jgi:hypothetical protein
MDKYFYQKNILLCDSLMLQISFSKNRFRTYFYSEIEDINFISTLH